MCRQVDQTQLLQRRRGGQSGKQESEILDVCVSERDGNMKNILVVLRGRRGLWGTCLHSFMHCLQVVLCCDTWLLRGTLQFSDRDEDGPGVLFFFALIQVIGMEEDVSVYDIADHPDFHFRTTDIVIRIWNSENGQNDCENEVGTVKNIFSVTCLSCALHITSLPF